MRGFVLGLLCVVPACVVLAGCNSSDQKNLTEDTKKLASTATEAAGNASLAGKVNGVFSVWKGIDMNGWQVEAKDGVVTLTGDVRNKTEKNRILYVVHQIRGVDKVVDNLKVKP